MNEVSQLIPYLTLVLLVLNFAFNRGDRSAGKIEALQKQQHQQALELRSVEASIRDHVGDKFATKADFDRLERSITASLDRVAVSTQQYHEALRTLLEPIAAQLIISPVRR